MLEVDPKACAALDWAAHRGHSRCVELLIPVSEPHADHSCALRHAAQNGHADCVALLLPASDPKASGEKGMDAAATARAHNHFDIAAMIESFIEARDLASSASNPPRSPVRAL